MTCRPALFVMSAIAAAAACGGSTLEGTYRNANGLATLELKAGGNASFALMGEQLTCTYKKDGAKLVLTCPNQDAMTLAIHEDGSLTPEGTFIGAMTKAKQP